MSNEFEYKVLYHYGSKKRFAEQMNISRWTAYRWIDNPSSIPIQYHKQLESMLDICFHANK